MIWIITSWVDNYKLIQLCQEQKLVYTIYVDTLLWSYQDIDDDTLRSRVQHLATQAKTDGCTQLLVSPRVELLLDTKELVLPVIPLFHSYLHYAFKHSLVGKIGYFWWYYDVELINRLHPEITKSYILTDAQRTTKPFHAPLVKWTKDVSPWILFHRYFGKRTMMINKIIKFDLRYFKDTFVDTLIPLSYSYFDYQKTITHFFNQKKQKFHPRDIVRSCFQDLTSWLSSDTQLTSVDIYYTWSPHIIQHPKRDRIASAGGKYTTHYHAL